MLVIYEVDGGGELIAWVFVVLTMCFSAPKSPADGSQALTLQLSSGTVALST